MAYYYRRRNYDGVVYSPDYYVRDHYEIAALPYRIELWLLKNTPGENEQTRWLVRISSRHANGYYMYTNFLITEWYDDARRYFEQVKWQKRKQNYDKYSKIS